MGRDTSEGIRGAMTGDGVNGVLCMLYADDLSLTTNDPSEMQCTIGRAELAAIAAALSHDYTHIATDSLSSPHQLRKQILYPEKHRHHVQGDVLKRISNLAQASQDHIFFYKVKSHAGLAENGCADQVAKYQASLKD
eukprot:1139186-Pelagomonas_calceolata.AAC.1